MHKKSALTNKAFIYIHENSVAFNVFTIFIQKGFWSFVNSYPLGPSIYRIIPVGLHDKYDKWDIFQGIAGVTREGKR